MPPSRLNSRTRVWRRSERESENSRTCFNIRGEIVTPDLPQRAPTSALARVQRPWETTTRSTTSVVVAVVGEEGQRERRLPRCPTIGHIEMNPDLGPGRPRTINFQDSNINNNSNNSNSSNTFTSKEGPHREPGLLRA
mmetsp:Transcript_12447/g.27360  ORF Transcript_12447/g.27360 Transcript_12447/m.27360 type:complete len:138 (+) Transcript_12447:57-470(+)